MEQCVACGHYILKPSFAVPLPTNTERKKIFAKCLGFNEDHFLNLRGRRYLCERHFNSADFFRNENGDATKLKPQAVPLSSRSLARSSSSYSMPTPSASVIHPPVQSPSSNRPSFFLPRFISNIITRRAPTDPKPSTSFQSPVPPPTSTPASSTSGQRFQSPFLSRSMPRPSMPLPSMPLPSMPRPSMPLPSMPRSTLSRPSTVANTDFENDFINANTVDTSQSNPKPPKKKRGPYKKYEPRIINLDETNFIPSAKKTAVVEEDNEFDVCDDERVEMVLISKDRLLQLFTSCPVCKTLLGKVKKELRVVGTAGTITYKCSKCQKRQTWATQDRIPDKKVFKGNALLSTAALLTPISFPTLKLLFNLARVSVFGNDRYKVTQTDVVWPVIGSVFNKEHNEMLKMLKNRKSAVNLLMDAQYDSPGFCAMMCKVTAIDAESGYAVAMQVLKKTWPVFDNVSGRMEPEGTRRILEGLQIGGVKVDRVTTDRSTTVMAMMKQYFPEIEHKRDAWHMVKGVKKDFFTEAKKKRSGNMIDFVSGLKNHFWYSIVEAKGDGELCREMLLSCLFHIIGIHKWQKGNICTQLTNFIKRQVGRNKKKMTAFLQKNPSKCSNFFKTLKFERITQCCHAAITPGNDDNDYMDPLGAGYFYVLNKLTAEKFLKDVVLLSPDLTTSQVESFHSIATGIYTPKRTYFPYTSYAMRSCLAVLHYNNNERSTKEGNRTVMRTVTYPSKAQNGQLTSKKVKSKAPIAWKHNIVSQCLEVFEKGEEILEDVYANEDEDSDGDTISITTDVRIEEYQEIDEEVEELEYDDEVEGDESEGEESEESEDF